MENLESILRIADKELDAVVQNGKFRSREEIDSVYKLIDVVKDIYCIWGMEDGGGTSNDGDMSYRNDGYSYARGRGRDAKRDSMGRYSRDGDRSGRSYRGYSRGDRREYIDGLREMMEDAPDDQTRQSIQRMIQQMEN